MTSDTIETESGPQNSRRNDPPTDRSRQIAFRARLYRLLSERPEYMTADRGVLVERMMAAQVPLGELDKTLLLHATELDRVCAHSVRMLKTARCAAVLDALGMMEADRMAAVYYALPPHRRATVLRDPVWAHHISLAPPETADMVAEVEALSEELIELAADNARTFSNDAPAQEALRRMEYYQRQGLMLDDAAGHLLAIFIEELGQLGDSPSDDRVAEACERTVERRRSELA